MIAYNTTGLDHAAIRGQAENAFKKGLLGAAELTGINNAFPEILYTPNFFIRIGLFLLTTVISICAMGLLGLFFLSGLTTSAIAGLLLFFGLGVYAILELFWVKEKNHFRSGIDDALIWVSVISILAGLMLLGGPDFETAADYAIICGIAVLMTIRFADMLMALTAFASGIAFIFLSGLDLSPVVGDLMPFIIMPVSFGAYRWFVRMGRKEKLRHYASCLTALSAAALITLYLAGNYFVVREMGAALLGKTGPLPAGWLFWIFTFAIPPAYIYFGIRFKNRVLLRCGLVLVGMIVFTVRYYHQLMPVENAMTLSGAVLIIAAWAVIRYLKQPKHGFTYEADETGDDMTGIKAAEAIVIAQTFHKTPQADDSFRFGGGTGGGGGASGDY